MEAEFRSAFWDDLNEALKDPTFRKEYEAQYLLCQRTFRAGWFKSTVMRIIRHIKGE